MHVDVIMETKLKVYQCHYERFLNECNSDRFSEIEYLPSYNQEINKRFASNTPPLQYISCRSWVGENTNIIKTRQVERLALYDGGTKS